MYHLYIYTVTIQGLGVFLTVNSLVCWRAKQAYLVVSMQDFSIICDDHCSDPSCPDLRTRLALILVLNVPYGTGKTVMFYTRDSKYTENTREILNWSWLLGKNVWH